LSSAIGEKFINSFQEISLMTEILGIKPNAQALAYCLGFKLNGKKRLMTELFYYTIISRYFPKIKFTLQWLGWFQLDTSSLMPEILGIKPNAQALAYCLGFKLNA
jgi:hypothetical protein